MKYPLPLLITTILVIAPWDVNGVGIMEWAKKPPEPTATVRHLGEERGFETEKESTSSGLARENFSSHGIKENRTDSSEASLQEKIEAAREDEAFWLEQQEWLVEMEKKFHALPARHEEREAILKNIEELIADAREAEGDWIKEREIFYHALAPNLTNYRTDPFCKAIEAARETAELAELFLAASQQAGKKLSIVGCHLSENHDLNRIKNAPFLNFSSINKKCSVPFKIKNRYTQTVVPADAGIQESVDLYSWFRKMFLTLPYSLRQTKRNHELKIPTENASLHPCLREGGDRNYQRERDDATDNRQPATDNRQPLSRSDKTCCESTCRLPRRIFNPQHSLASSSAASPFLRLRQTSVNFLRCKRTGIKIRTLWNRPLHKIRAWRDGAESDAKGFGRVYFSRA